MGSAASPFIIDDAIVGLAQPLTEALNQLASGPRRACDLIEELGRREDFYLDLAGGSSRRTAGAVFHNAHLPYKLSRANRAEKDGVAIEFPEYVDGTAEEAKTLSAGSPSLKRTCPSAKRVQVIAVLSTSLPTSARMDASTHRAISRGFTTFTIRGIQPASIQALPSDAHLDSGVKVPMPIQAPLFLPLPALRSI